MTFCLVALLWLVGGAALALLPGRAGRMAGLAGALGGSLTGLVGAASGGPEQFRLAWTLPTGAFALRLDPLSGFFLALVLGVALPISLYFHEYHEELSWCLYDLFLAAMALVVLAHDALLFLLAWEGMTLASYGLVNAHHERAEVRAAGRLYLICSQVGVACLIALLLSPGPASWLPVLALIGFGMKLGLAPLHFWLPEAHPAAPSPVSAAMSALMVKLGLYGLLRLLPPSWGAVLLLLGAASALHGALLAALQRELKRLLAYSTVENVGLIAAGLGLSLLARSQGEAPLAALAMTAALWQTVSHALFKSLQFMAAGNLLSRFGHGNLDRLGGCLRALPHTARLSWLACMGMLGMPALGGVVGEWLLGWAALESLLSSSRALQLAGLGLLTTLALVAGLALAGMTRLVGMAWLGEPREPLPAAQHGESRLPLELVGGAALALGLGAPLWLGRLAPVLACLNLPPRIDLPATAWQLESGVLLFVTLAALLILATRRGAPPAVPTWDCGYHAPSPRMQYTGTGFAQPLASLSAWRPRQELLAPLGAASLRVLAALRSLQHGRLQLYVFYILIALAVSWLGLEWA